MAEAGSMFVKDWCPTATFLLPSTLLANEDQPIAIFELPTSLAIKELLPTATL